MTLSARNAVFRGGIVFAIFCLLLCAAASFKAIPVYPSMEAEITRRSGGVFQAFTGRFMDTDLLAVHCGILAIILYSVLSIIFICYFFEKTQSPEILFVVLFAASFSPEVLRLILPLGRQYAIPSLYPLMAARIIIFCRYFGIFSLFAASVNAVGFEAQKQRNIIIFITVTTLFIALGVPIDTQLWDSSLNMINGYISMFTLIEGGTFLITTVSFFIAAWSRGSREFAFIGAGSVLAFAGRSILLSADTWLGLPAGMPLLIAGTWLICINLHKIYLWL